MIGEGESEAEKDSNHALPTVSGDAEAVLPSPKPAVAEKKEAVMTGAVTDTEEKVNNPLVVKMISQWVDSLPQNQKTVEKVNMISQWVDSLPELKKLIEKVKITPEMEDSLPEIQKKVEKVSTRNEFETILKDAFKKLPQLQVN